MARAVEIFNVFDAINGGMELTETEGWLFMVALKLARAERSDNPDHYIDMVGYIALLGEHVLEGSQDAGLTAPKSQSVPNPCTEIPMPSPWIQHDNKQLSPAGRPLGLDATDVVEVILRDGSVREGTVRAFFWDQGGFASDILFYRKASKPEDKEKEEEEGVVHKNTCCNCGNTFKVTPMLQRCPVCNHHHEYQYPL
jgi:hypothetical protein